MQLSCLRLSHFQDLSQESGGAVDVAVHYEIVFLIQWCHLLELVDGGRDDGKRGEQLVGDVGEDDTHLQAVSGFHPLLIPSGSSKEAANEHQDIEHEGYSGGIPWRQHLDGDGVGQFLPMTITVVCLQMKQVVARWQVLEGGAMVVAYQILPVAIISIQLIGIDVLLCIAIGEQTEVYAELLDLCRQHDVPGIARHFLADFFLEVRLQGCERYVVYIELSYYQFALAPLEMGEVFCWEEREEIGLSAKEELVFILEGGVG